MELTLGDANFTNPPIFIDAREHEAQILTSLPDGLEPAAKVTIKPEYIQRFHTGLLCPRLGLFQDARSFPKSVPQGDVAKVIRLADLLNKNPPRLLQPATEFDEAKLPKPTEDIEQVKKDLEVWGYG